jgi:hypothetical protein
MAASINNVLEFLARLRAAKIQYRLNSFRRDAIAVEVAVPGERWEIEFMDDGSIEIERFVSDGTIHDESALDELFARFPD